MSAAIASGPGGAGLSAIERLLIEQACERLPVRYCVTADRHDLEGFLDVFTADAIWRLPDGSAYQGRAEIRDYFAGRPRAPARSHICSNVLVDVLDAAHARGTSNATVLREFPPAGEGRAGQMLVHNILEYEDIYLKQADGAWRISHRTGRLVFPAG